MNVSQMQFSGKLLKRGFWLYVWDVREDQRRHLYVGRTGDSSSPKASSPFRRIGQHLETKLNAKGNSMLKRLRAEHIDPEACTFEMTAIGPIFDERKTMPEHEPYRDKTASLEAALVAELKERGYNVLGQHPKSTEPDGELMAQVQEKLISLFPSLNHPLSDGPRFRPVQLRGGMTASEIIIRDRGER